MDQPWKTDKWFTSPWCYLPEVRKNDTFASKIKIHDVTLRDGEQQTAVVFRREEKVAIAKQLDALGIHRIEAGMPAVSPQDKAAISDIAALGLKAEIFAFARCIPEEIKVVKDVGCKGVVVEIPAEVVTKIGDPAYQPAIIPANTYEGQSRDVPAIAIQNFLVTHEGVPADTVYKMTKAMWDNLDALVAAHAAGKAIKKENALKGMPVPLHPGAEKYYREAGMLK
jgi:hypothetical protein